VSKAVKVDQIIKHLLDRFFTENHLFLAAIFVELFFFFFIENLWKIPRKFPHQKFINQINLNFQTIIKKPFI
jgi:hypothetical protein